MVESELSAPVERSSESFGWHRIVGVLGLVYALLGMLMYGALLVVLLAWDFLMKASGMGDMPKPPDFIVGMVLMGVLFLLGVVLAVGSTQLILRRARGAALLRFWAGARLLMVVIALGQAVLYMQPKIDFDIEITERQRALAIERGADPDKIPVRDRAQMERWYRTMNGGLALLTAAFPLFVGILLTSRRKREEIATWSSLGSSLD